MVHPSPILDPTRLAPPGQRHDFEGKGTPNYPLLHQLMYYRSTQRERISFSGTIQRRAELP